MRSIFRSLRIRLKPMMALAGALCFLAAGRALGAPSGEEILRRLEPGHPRLLARVEDFNRLKRRENSPDRIWRSWHAQLTKEAGQVLEARVSRYEIPDGLRLLATSRRVLDRTYTLALLYRLDGDKRYAERAWGELEAAAKFPDWNPRHFLDTAEMTHAFAIGYDWLFDVWTPEQKKVLRQAMLEKGLRVGLACYRARSGHGWWVKARHNWNQVCNGGLGLGALAVADEEPALAGEILHDALESLELPMAEFAPDGAWAEGPGYWNYATFYNVVFLAGLESGLGTDFGFSNKPGFSETGFFPIYLTGPAGRTFNYADGSDGHLRAPQLFWLARKFGRSAFARYELANRSRRPLDLLWWRAEFGSSAGAGLELNRYFRRAELVSLRSGWDSDALFLAFKGGDNKANHSHLDLGNFVLDALGKRWAVDLGADDYNLPGYFGKNRWSYYRLRTEGHNLFVIDPAANPGQNPEAGARIVRCDLSGERPFAVADLTEAYSSRARRAQRGVMMLNRSSVLVQDEIEPNGASEIWWFLHSPAEIEISKDGSNAVLKQGQARLWAKILSPARAAFQAMAAAPLPNSPHPARQANNPAIRKLAIHLQGARATRLAVWLAPLRGGQNPPERTPEVKPLAAW